MKSIKTFALAATVAMGSTVAAQAALVDFTNPSTYTLSGTTGSGTSVDGTLGFTLSSMGGGNITNNEVADYEADRVSPLSGQVDGLGIESPNSNDEITYPLEALTVTFDRAVTISRLYFLDLFGVRPGVAEDEDDESAVVTTDGGMSEEFFAQTLNQDGTVGFGDFMTNLTGTSFTFTAGLQNDAFAFPDFALAGFEVTEVPVSPVPVPAGILLLGGALGGLGLARRKNKAA